MPQTKTCPVCEKTFEITSKYKAQICCSIECRAEKQSKKIEYICKQCGKTFLEAPSSRAKYCSSECKYRAAQKTKLVICKTCGKEFTCRPSKDRIYCSNDCKVKDRVLKIDNVCEVCGKVFKTRPCQMRTRCSRYCDAQAKSQKVPCTCVVCGKTEYRQPAKASQLCSIRCARKHKGPTSIEQRVEQSLKELSIEYIDEHPMGRYHIDFFLPRHDTCLEVDGDYWHSIATTIERDARRDRHLRNRGYRVIRISESDINAAKSVTTLVAQRLGLID